MSTMDPTNKELGKTCPTCTNICRTDGQHKVKRLKTHRERREMRGNPGRETIKTSKLHHQSDCNSKRNVFFAKVVPAAQDASVITDRRLIGHYGLFNHEVKSVDIERLLHEQTKPVKGKNAQETSSHPSSVAPTPDTRVEKVINPESDLSPAQRPRQQPDLSTESYKSIFSSQNTFLNISTSKDEAVGSVLLHKNVGPPPTVDNEETHTTTENKELHSHPRESSGPRLPLSSSSDTPLRGEDPASVSFVTGMAPRLCGCVHFQRLRRSDLLAESRAELLKLLRESGGARHHLQQLFSFDDGLTKAAGDQSLETTRKNEDVPSADAPAYHTESVRQGHFDLQKTMARTEKISKHFSKGSWIPETRHIQKQSAEWLPNTADTRMSPADVILQPQSSPLFGLDFEANRYPASFCVLSPRRLNSPKCNEPKNYYSFENLSREVEETCYWPPAPAERQSDPFKTDTYFSPSFPIQVQTPNLRRHFHNPPAYDALLTTFQSDMLHDSPSQMFERGPASQLIPFPSPEQWHFPPMKLF